MPFHPDVKKKIVREANGDHKPCTICGITFPTPDAAHIIDEKEWHAKHGQDSQVNGLPLCPNCHRIFDEKLRPKLFTALEKFGTTGLPKSWSNSNKVTT